MYIHVERKPIQKKQKKSGTKSENPFFFKKKNKYIKVRQKINCNASMFQAMLFNENQSQMKAPTLLEAWIGYVDGR